MSSDINKISNLITSQLKLVDESVIKNDHFDWNRIKRTPQYLKQKIKYNGGSYTIDEEFDQLQQQLNHYEKTIKYLLKNSKVFFESMIAIPNLSTSISETFQNLIDPYNNFISGGEVIQEEYDSWIKVSNYKKFFTDILLDDEIKQISKVIDSKLEDCLKSFKTVEKKIKTREFALLDYDKVYNDLETLILKQEQGELTLKQNNQLFSLRRKLQDNKTKYDEINQLLKKQLPKFLQLVQEIIAPIQAMTYYINLQFNYSILTESKKLFGIETTGEIIKKYRICNEPFIETIENFTLVSTKPQQHQQYVQAKFSFKAQESTDLTILKGDIIKLLQQDSDSEWWKGELNGKIGNFPANYVQKI
ncbi:Protein hob1 [Spathaspora sp. JA1]|nr:Protein hob1 [Spathaspora sp. JA1]